VALAPAEASVAGLKKKLLNAHEQLLKELEEELARAAKEKKEK
jgi:hypothetical protein